MPLMALHLLAKMLLSVEYARFLSFNQPIKARICDATLVLMLYFTRGSAIAEEPRDALRQLKYYGRFLTELLTRSSANAQEPCEHTVS